MHIPEQNLLTSSHSVFESMRAATDLDAILKESVQHIRAAMGFDRAAIFLVDTEHGIIQGTWGTDAEGNSEDCHIHTYPLNSDDSFARIYRGEIPFFFTEDLSVLPGLDSDYAKLGVKHNVVVAMRWQEAMTGFIAVDNLLSGRPFGTEIIEPLEAFGAQVALAIYLNKIQRKLVRYERLAALGELANAVRHEINNPLQAIIGYGQLLLHQGNQLPDDVRSVLLVMQQQAERISDIVRKLASPPDLPVEVVRGLWMTDLHAR